MNKTDTSQHAEFRQRAFTTNVEEHWTVRLFPKGFIHNEFLSIKRRVWVCTDYSNMLCSFYLDSFLITSITSFSHSSY